MLLFYEFSVAAYTHWHTYTQHNKNDTDREMERNCLLGKCNRAHSLRFYGFFLYEKKRIKFLGNEIQKRVAKVHAVGSSSCAIKYKTKQTLKSFSGFNMNLVIFNIRRSSSCFMSHRIVAFKWTLRWGWSCSSAGFTLQLYYFLQIVHFYNRKKYVSQWLVELFWAFFKFFFPLREKRQKKRKGRRKTKKKR